MQMLCASQQINKKSNRKGWKEGQIEGQKDRSSEFGSTAAEKLGKYFPSKRGSLMCLMLNVAHFFRTILVHLELN